MRANAAAASGDVRTARRVGDESLRLAERLERATLTVLGRCNHAMVRLYEGDAEGCRREMLAVAGEDFDVGEPAWSVHLLAALVTACVQCGDLEEADRWAAKAQEISAALGDPAIPGGRARCARAEVLLARGDAQEAGRLAAEAAEMAAALGARLNVWQALLVSARAQAAAGLRAEAVATLRQVADEASAGGAGLYAEMATRELRALGERLGRSGRRAPAGAHGLDSLSDREREIADLVAQGRTNKEIAAALFLSDKTVERHLSRTFEKLGLRSRVELAALVHER
jgi:DNA-binding NarL/FixJ family response regulator